MSDANDRRVLVGYTIRRTFKTPPHRGCTLWAGLHLLYPTRDDADRALAQYVTGRDNRFTYDVAEVYMPAPELSDADRARADAATARVPTRCEHDYFSESAIVNMCRHCHGTEVEHLRAALAEALARWEEAACDYSHERGYSGALDPDDVARIAELRKLVTS